MTLSRDSFLHYPNIDLHKSAYPARVIIVKIALLQEQYLSCVSNYAAYFKFGITVGACIIFEQCIIRKHTQGATCGATMTVTSYPGLHPHFISQPWRKVGCEIKSGWRPGYEVTMTVP